MAKQAGLAGWLAGFLRTDHSLGWTVRRKLFCLPHHHAFQSGPSQTKPLRGSLSPPQRHPGPCAYQQRSAAQDSTPTGPSRCRHWQMMHRTALRCTVPRWCSKQAIKQPASTQAASRLLLRPPSLAAGQTAPHRTAPVAPNGIPSSPSLHFLSFLPAPPSRIPHPP